MKKTTGLLISITALVLSLGATLGIEAANNSAKQAEAIEAAGKVALEATPSGYTNVYRFTVPHDFGSDVSNHIYLNAWGSSGGDTTWGNFITLSDYSYNENSERMYTYATNYTYTGFQIIRYYDNPNYCKTADINVGSNKAWSWNGTNGAAASAWTPTNITYYLYDYRNLFGGAAKCYAWQSNGSLNNGDYPGESMAAVQYGSGQLYSISLDPAFDRFKCGIGDSANTGDVWINQHRDECFCWWDAGDSSWSNDLDWVKAHDWIYETMHVRDIETSVQTDTGACRGSTGYYQKAKTAYNSFSSSIRSKIAADSRYTVAAERFVAWARANGDIASYNDTTIATSGNAIRSIVTTSVGDDNTAVVVIVTFVAVGAIASYFFIGKKKKQ